MLNFEIKKIIKSNVILSVLVFALIMALYVNFISNITYNLDSKYPSYGKAGSSHIFNGSVMDNKYKIKNSAKFFDTFNKNHYKYGRQNYPWLVDFLKNLEKKSFKEMYEVGKFVQKLDYGQLESIKKLQKEHEIKIEDENDRKTFEYGIFEAEYYHDNNIPFTKYFEQILTTNFARRVVYNSYTIFGLPFICFLILAFYGIISKEKDEGTVNLLKGQPISREKLVFSKLLSMILISATYILSFLLFLMIICAVQGIHLGGFYDIFRVYHEGVDIRYIKGYELIFLIVLSFMIITTLFSSLIIMINTLSKNKEVALSILIVVFGLGYTLTENIGYLQTRFNPIYALNHVRTIIGKFREITEINGHSYIDNINQSSLFYLLVFLIFAIMIYGISVLIFNKNIVFGDSTRNANIKNYNIFKFEIRKLIKTSSFQIYMIFALVFAFSLYGFNVKEVNDKSNYILGEKGSIADLKKELKNAEENLLNSKNEMEKIVFQKEIDQIKNKIKNQEKLISSYKSGKIKEFYNAQLEKSTYYFDKQGKSHYEYKFEKPMRLGIIETKLLDKNSIRDGVSPILRYSFNHSEYEQFVNGEFEREILKREQYLTNAGLYSFFRMVKYQNLDILFLILIVFMVLGGYVYEKENGNQLNLIYTQPINKFKYHIQKVLSQFIVIIGVFGVVMFFVILLGILFEGIGDFNQPVIEYLRFFEKAKYATEYNSKDTFTTMPIYIYLIRLFVVIGLQGLFLSSIATLISIFTKSKIFIISSVIGICALGALLVKIINVNILKLLNPFNYLFANNIADNSIVAKLNMSGGSYLFSLLILILWSILIMIVGAKLSQNKQQI